MRFILIIITFSLVSCNTLTQQEKLHDIILGDWLVLLADHKLENEEQRILYGHMQDSVIEAKALKLLRFFEDGSFQQVDYPDQKGKWAISPKQELYIANGGTGFKEFKSKYLEYKDEQLQLVEYLHADKETIKLVWYLKKVKVPELVKPENNNWRHKAARLESEEEIRKRLGIMFAYYSDYFALINKESTYFISKRVMLPLKFYQHAMGSLPYNPESDFAQLFFNEQQAQQAYGYMKNGVYNGGHFPSGENFVDEYSKFMRQVSVKITKMN